MMHKIAAIIVLAIMAMGAACQTTKPPPLVVPKNRVWRIPEEFLVCTKVVYPNATTLTDKQVARLIVELERNLNICHLNMETIRRLQAHAIAQIEGESAVFDDAK